MSNLKTIKVKNFDDVPKNFTGIAKESNGSKYWYKDGQLHREDGPAIEYFDGTKKWFLNDKLHREDGPAVEEYDGTKVWYKNDKLHREGGPAVKYPDGTKEYWLNNIKLSKEHYKLIMISSEESREKLYENDNRGLKNLLAYNE